MIQDLRIRIGGKGKPPGRWIKVANRFEGSLENPDLIGVNTSVAAETSSEILR
jgi:hypothetical protein